MLNTDCQTESVIYVSSCCSCVLYAKNGTCPQCLNDCEPVEMAIVEDDDGESWILG
jgi:hypothetical protein